MNSFEKSAIKKILAVINKNKEVVLGLPTGKTPLPIYEKLIQKNKEGVDFSNVIVFQLDELLGISPESDYSYQKYLKEKFLNHVNIKEKNCYFFNSKADDYKKEINRFESLIKEKGGIDLQLLGIGENGHIGFNEPIIKINYNFFEKPDKEKIKKYNKFIINAPKAQYKRIINQAVDLKENLKREIIKELPQKPGREALAQKIKNQKIIFFIAREQLKEKIKSPLSNVEIKDFKDAFNSPIHVEELSLPTLKNKATSFNNLKEMPVRAITLGIDTILNSKKIILLARGGRKAEIIQKTLKKPISIRCPASLLRKHSNTSFVLDDAAASLLSLEEEKNRFWKIKALLAKKYLSFSEKKRYLTIDLGGTYCRASLRNKKGKLLFAPLQVKTLALEGKEVILNQIIKVSYPLLKIGDPKKTKILLATAGKIKRERGVIEEARNLNIKNFSITKELKEKLPFSASSIQIVNDIVSAWCGERQLVENDNFVSLYFSTGVGGAFKDKNLEPGWKVALSLDKEKEVNAARFLAEKEKTFYKKEDLRKSEYFLEDLAGGSALVSFAKESALSFPKSKLAQRIQEGKVEKIPEELSKKAKKGSSFARYCLKRTGKYAGIGIVTIYNHFFKREDKISFNENTKFLINGSAGLDPYYFKGIKAGIKKGNKLMENNLKVTNVAHSKFKNSTEGVQRGIILYYINLIKNKISFPEEEKVIISNKNVPPSLVSWAVPKGKEIIVLTKKEKVFATNLIQKLKEENVVKEISVKKWRKKKFNPDLLLAPENEEIDFKGPILFYKTFPFSTEDLTFNSYFEFNKVKRLLEPIKAYKKEIERVRYDIWSKFHTKYYAELLKYLSASKKNHAHIFNIKKAENGEIKDIKGLTSIKNIINREKGISIFISPHADDMEISSGALIKWMIKNGENLENWIITESHKERERREKEALIAQKRLSTRKNQLEIDFMGFHKDKILEEEIKDKIKYRIKGIKNLKMIFLPSPKDKHPTHQKVRKVLEEILLKEKDEFLIAYYNSPWIYDYDVYYLSDHNYGETEESKIASYLKEALGKSGILGELCGKLKDKGFFGDYGEPFKTN